MTNLKINTNKPFLIFGMPRSGTTLMMSIIKTYSLERFNISEYFNIDYTIIDDNIKLTAHTKNRTDNCYLLDDKEINQRIEKLRKYRDQKIIIKIMPMQITNTIFEYIKNKKIYPFLYLSSFHIFFTADKDKHAIFYEEASNIDFGGFIKYQKFMDVKLFVQEQ